MEAPASSVFAEVIARIRANDPEGTKSLYEMFCWVRGYFAQKLGQHDADDRYHDLIATVVVNIRQGRLRDAARLGGYVRATASNFLSDHLRKISRARKREVHENWWGVADSAPGAEDVAIDRELMTIASQVLGGLSRRDRAVLVRFYLEEQEPSRICSDLGLSETQFRLIKSRAKGRLRDRIRARIGPPRRGVQVRPPSVL